MKYSKVHLSGIIFMIQSSVAFSFMALCVKIASRSLSSFEVVFFRSLIGTVMILVMIFFKQVPVLGTQRKLMALRGLSGFMAVMLFFYALAHLPLGTAVLLNFTTPVFVVILAMLFLRERPGIFLVLMILMAFTGVYLLIGPYRAAWEIPALLGLASAFFAGIAFIAIRKIRHRESPLTVILYFTGISTLGSLAFLPFGFRWPAVIEWLALAGVGIGSFFGQLWMTIALRRTPASLVTPFSYLTPLLAFLYGFLLWRETFSERSLFGAFLIILAGLLISYFGTRRQIR